MCIISTAQLGKKAEVNELFQHKFYLFYPNFLIPSLNIEISSQIITRQGQMSKAKVKIFSPNLLNRRPWQEPILPCWSLGPHETENISQPYPHLPKSFDSTLCFFLKIVIYPSKNSSLKLPNFLIHQLE